MRAIGEAVEEQVGERIAREMFGIADLSAQMMRSRRHAARGRIFDETGIAVVGRLQHPQHAARRRRRGSSSHRSNMRCVSFCVALNAAEDEGVVGQAEIGARRRSSRDDAQPVVRLVAGQAQHLFGIENLVALGDDRRVGDQIMMVGRAHRRGIAEPVDLHGRRPEREHAACARIWCSR